MRKIKSDFRKLGDLKHVILKEILKKQRTKKPDANLSELDKFNVEIKPELMICMSEEVFPYNRKCHSVPVSII